MKDRVMATGIALALVGCSGGTKHVSALSDPAPTPGASTSHADQTSAGTTPSPLNNGSAPTPVSEAAAIALASSDAAADAAGSDVRYFNLSYLQVSKVSSKDQLTVRKAVGKLLNSLSWLPTVTVPAAIDQGGLLLKIHLRDYGWTAQTWTTLTASYPDISTEIAGLSALAQLTGAAKPVVRAEWFVSNASLAPLYFNVLGVAADFTQLQRAIGIDVGADVVAENVIRSGFDQSVVSTNDRIVERHALGSGGYFWRSYEFGTKTGTQNILQAPLGPVRYFTNTQTKPGLGNHPLPGVHTDLNTNKMFNDDGGEVYFTLPNGLLAFYITNGSDQRIDKVPGAKDSIFAGYSCMSCHFHGPIAKADMVGPAAAVLNLSPPEQAAVSKIYVDQTVFAEQVRSDSNAFIATLAKLGLSADEGDSVSGVVRMNLNENL